MSLLGSYGQYAGPSAGNTPDDDEELRGNGDNPFNTGDALSSAILQRPSMYPTLPGIAGTSGQNPSVPGYYFNPPPSGDNPYSAGAWTERPAEQAAEQSIAQGLAATYAQPQLQTGYPASAPEPNASDAYSQRVRIDQGLDDQLIPHDQRR